MSLEKLAQMVQRGFAEGATKQDLKTLATKEELKLLREDFGILRRDTEADFGAVIHTLKSIQGEVKDLQGMDAELTTIRVRLARVERKIGLTR